MVLIFISVMLSVVEHLSMYLGHLDVFGEMSVCVLSIFLSWVIYIFDAEMCKFCMYFGY